MPYILNDFRRQLDKEIEAFIAKVNLIHTQMPAQTRDGLLNYSLTRILNGVYPNTKYHELNEVIGMLECCKLEYYRKRIAPYEDIKEMENGVVETYAPAPAPSAKRPVKAASKKPASKAKVKKISKAALAKKVSKY